MTNQENGNSTKNTGAPPRWRPAPERAVFAEITLHLVLMMIDSLPALRASIALRKHIILELEQDGYDPEETRRRFLRMLSVIKVERMEKGLTRNRAAENLADSEQE